MAAESKTDQQGSLGVVTQMDAPVDAARFEAIYREAAGDISKIPWADARPNPMLVAWLNAEAPGLIRPGSRVAVVGCGLGDDVVELQGRGYDAMGFDVSPTALSWAKRRFPEQARCFTAADVLNLPTRLRHRFDLVVEIYTIQSLHPSLREEAAGAVVSLTAAHGVLLAVCRGRDESVMLEQAEGPPWPLTVSELTGLMEASGMRSLKDVESFDDDQTPPVRRIRGAFVHA